MTEAMSTELVPVPARTLAERNLIRERTKAGLEAARARGRKGGRRPKLDARLRALAVDLYRQKKHKVEEICDMVGITKPTLYAYVREAEGRGLHSPEAMVKVFRKDNNIGRILFA